MHYSPLLDTTYRNMMDCPISEIEYYRNISDNLDRLNKETFVKIEVNNPIGDYVFNACMELELTEVEYFLVRQRFDAYLKQGYLKNDALQGAMNDVLGKMD